MTDTISITVLHDGDSENYAKEIWTSLAKRAKETTGVQMAGEWDPTGTQPQFRWKQLRPVTLRPFERDRDADGKFVPDMPHVEIGYDPEPFQDALDAGDEPELAETAVDLLELVEHAYAGGPECPRFVYGVTEPHRARLVDGDVPPPVTVESLADHRIEYACWLMGFPPSIVETYGRETLLSTPAWQTSELSDGGIVILATENPTNVSKPETRAIDQHLDLEPPPETEECRY